MERQIVVDFGIDPGANRYSGGKAWAKSLVDIDPSKGDGYGLIGEWIPEVDSKSNLQLRTFTVALPEGSLIVMSGKVQTHKRPSVSYLLARVIGCDDGFAHEIDSQKYTGRCLEMIAASNTRVNSQKVVDEYPELAPCVGKRLLPLYYAARKLLPQKQHILEPSRLIELNQ